MHLIFVGDEFYSRSSTMMSSLYTTDFQRYDWGYVQRDLRNGIEIHIRPANTQEYEHLKAKLDAYIDDAASSKSWSGHPWVYGLGNLEKVTGGYQDFNGNFFNEEGLIEAVRKAKDF